MGLKKNGESFKQIIFHFSDCSRDIANLMIFRNYDEKRWK
ncbi:hypothetical protein LNO81_17310 [Klebsiella variicola subsp. variicola]|nr:hypothetical protein [Klebsiella variicola subsp. variicola]